MKKTVLHAAILALSMPMTLNALGLGEMTIESALDQPFLAEIEIIDVGSAPLASVRVSLADPENFAEIGLEPAPILGLLTFKIDRNKKGKAVIVVQSTERMTEPYMELVVDMAWPNGQIYKAYTVLLDPPGYQLVFAKAQSSVTYYKKNNAHGQPGVIDKTIVSTAQHNPVNLNDSKKKATYGPTITNESVWQIAQRYKTSEVILPQVVLAIVGANPDAFNKGNLNSLKIGVRLNIPSTEEIAQVPADLATEEVMAHDKAWNEKTSIDHVLAPPYMNAQAASGTNSNIPSLPNTNSSSDSADTNTNAPSINVEPQNSEIPAIPKLTMQSVIPQSTPQLIPTNSAVPVTANNQQQPVVQNKIPQSSEQDATLKAELSITSAAVESVRESNAILMEQLHLLQNQNKKLQEQLDKRDKEIEKMNAQMQVIIKQRTAVASQATPAAPVDNSSSYWPLYLLLLLAAGGGGFAYWYFKIREQSNEESPYLSETPAEPKPFIPLAEPIAISQQEDTSASTNTAGSTVEEKPIEAPDVHEKPVVEKHSTSIEPIEQHLESPEEKIEPSVKKSGRKKQTTVEEPLVSSAPEATLEPEVPEQLETVAPEEPIPELPEEPTKDLIEFDIKTETKDSVKEIPADLSQDSQNEDDNEFISIEPVAEEKIDPVPEVQHEDSEEPIHNGTDVSHDEESTEHDLLEFETSFKEMTEEKADVENPSAEQTKDEDSDMGLDFIPVPVQSAKEDELLKEDAVNADEEPSLDFTTEAPVQEKAPTLGDENHGIDQSITDFFADQNTSENAETAEPKVDKSEESADGETDQTTNPLKSKKALNTLLDLAKTYIGMDDIDSARHSLEEVLEHGSESQKEIAKQLLDEIKDKK